jgi:hypothetical protein
VSFVGSASSGPEQRSSEILEAQSLGTARRFEAPARGPDPGEEVIMGASSDTFVKYPRTPHLFGSRGTDDDKPLGRAESANLIADRSLIAEEKLDGTRDGRM